MTSTRVRRFSILQAGKLFGVMYGFVALILLPFGLLTFLSHHDERGGGTFCFVIVIYPLLGFISGVIGAAFYNLAAHLVGGLELELELESTDGSPQETSLDR